MPRQSLLLMIGILLFSASASVAQPQFYEDQPDDKKSTLFGLDWETITDKQFADMARGLLLDGETPNARGAMFLFEQCYSGGMLDDIESALGNEVRWVGGAAARHDQLSWGESNSKDFPLDFWVKSLDQAMDLSGTASMINYVNLARTFDATGPNGSADESPQSIYRNGGENIFHKETISESDGGHNAILWAGNADGKRHNNDIKVMYENLVRDFQATGNPWSIIVLGDSAKLGFEALPATRANLQLAFDTLKAIQGPNDDFLFFASDHGGLDTVLIEDQTLLGTGELLNRSFEISQSELDGILMTPGNIPGILLSVHDISPGLRLFVDGFELQDPFERIDSQGDAFLPISHDVLRQIGLDFQITLLNETGDEVMLDELVFRTGGITNAVPEHGSIILVSVGIGMIIWAYRRRGVGLPGQH